MEPWDYLLKVGRRNAGTHWYLSVSLTDVHSVNTDSRVPRPADSSRMVELQESQRHDKCLFVLFFLLGPCSSAVHIPLLIYRRLPMWDLILPVSFVPLHHREMWQMLCRQRVYEAAPECDFVQTKPAATLQHFFFCCFPSCLPPCSVALETQLSTFVIAHQTAKGVKWP